jgi:hypothetical protein
LSERKGLLVGSIPFANEREAMKIAAEMLGNKLISLPDGEVGEKNERYPEGSRSAWVMNVIDMCIDDTENWEIIQKGKLLPNGFPVDYNTLYKLRPKHAPKDVVKFLNFHYLETYKQSYMLYQQVKKQHGLRIPFQVGVPTGMAMSLHMLEPENIFRYYDAFNERLAFEMNQVIERTGEDILIQIECPAETGLVYSNPPQVDFALNSLLGLVRRLNNSVKIGIHFCYGDLNNRSLIHPESLEPLVDFVNTCIEQWPENYQLAYIHIPLAEGNISPTADLSYYQPLKKINVPTGTRFVAGFIHEKNSMDELKQVLHCFDELRGQPVDVACSCGLGRRKPEVALELIRRMAELTTR